jgi:hypothetical protein
MKGIGRIAIALVLLLVVLVGALGLQPGPSTIIFEGEFADTPYGTLQDGVYSMRFAIYDSSMGGNQIWPDGGSYEEHAFVLVTAGRFTVELGSQGQPLPDRVHQAAGRYVQVSVCQPAGFECDGFELLPIRLPLAVPAYMSLETPVPGSGEDSDGDYEVVETSSGGVSDAWLLGGNAGTSPSANFVGTLDDASLSIRVAGRTALRIEPHPISPNLIGGHQLNGVSENAYGAAIGGGGIEGKPNLVSAEFGTIGGGEWNRVLGRYGTVSGGQWNHVGPFATVGGGTGNSASGWHTTIPGGGGNRALADSATVGGGRDNEASGAWSTVAGGVSNVASGSFSVVPGGQYNTASEESSFAAGTMARAMHPGSFVWADSLGVEFASTEGNQFLIRSFGGAVFNLGTSRFGLVVRSGSSSFSSSIPDPAPYYAYTTLLAVNERARDDSIGVWGHAGGALDPQTRPGQAGVFGSARSGVGIAGITNGSSDNLAAGWFRAESNAGRTFAVYGQNFSGDEGSAGGFFTGRAAGLIAEAPDGGNAVVARVRKETTEAAHGYGVYAEGGLVGVYGEPRQFDTNYWNREEATYGVYGKSDSPYGYGLYSEGNAHVDGNLTWEPKVGYVSVGPVSLVATHALGMLSTGDRHVDEDGIRPKTFCNSFEQSYQRYWAGLQLPHGVKLRSIELYYDETVVQVVGQSEEFRYGERPDDSETYLRLVKTDLKGDENELTVICTKGRGDSSRIASLDHVVDNSTGTYYVHLELDCRTTFYGIVISYEVSEPY